MARAIDADDLLLYLHCRMGQIPCDEYGLYLVADIAEYVAKMPTVEAGPVKHGKWIKKTWHSRGGYLYLKCDCGKEHCIEKPIDDIVDICSECGKINEASFRNYCPHCGARMDGE